MEKLQTGLHPSEQIQDLLLPNELLTSTSDIILAVVDKEKSLPSVASKLSDMMIARPGGGTQVSKLKKEVGEKYTKTILAALIYDLRDSFNTRFSLTDSQIKMIVDVLLTDYWHLKVEQIARAFHLQKLGEGVKIYETLDVKTVLLILNSYELNIALPERHAEAMNHKEFIEERETSSAGKEEVEKMKEATNRYLLEKEVNSKKSK